MSDRQFEDKVIQDSIEAGHAAFWRVYPESIRNSRSVNGASGVSAQDAQAAAAAGERARVLAILDVLREAQRVEQARHPAIPAHGVSADSIATGSITSAEVTVADRDYDAAAFATRLGLDPTQITSEGVRISFMDQIAIARWNGFKRVDPGQVLAALSSSLRTGDDGPGEPEGFDVDFSKAEQP